MSVIGAEGNDTFLLGDATKFYYNDGIDSAISPNPRKDTAMPCPYLQALEYVADE
ncbi:MAG: hypothetical protein HC849_18220 [Oscillatoriales cyanobacterium RU_3_3]|nr:hypothetical protein [Oscillatoriales cyanobacterium RU_3_3]